jgi:multidrug efflux pump subunit AcrA (membrane-fusion protein)
VRRHPQVASFGDKSTAAVASLGDKSTAAVVAVFVVIATLLVTAASCSDDSDDVGLGTAGRADVTEVVDAPATVTARAVATLSAPAEGTLGMLMVEPGATVAPGQVLAVIDSPKAQQQLSTAAEALDALKSGGAAGSNRFVAEGGDGDGVKDLSAAQGRTDQAAAAAFAQAREAANKITDPVTRTALLAQVDAAEAAYKEASSSARALIGSVQRGLASVGQAMNALTAAQRIQARAAYDLAKSTVDALTLRAPVAGVVQLGGPATTAGPSLTDLLGGNAAALGAAAGAGAVPDSTASGPGIDPAPAVGTRVTAGTTILTVVDLTEPGLLAEVDETDILLVATGVKATVELDAAPGARYEATVRSVDLLPSASAQGGVSYRARLALAAGTFPDGRAAPAPRPGMSAVAHLSVRSASSAVVVPAASVFNADGRDQIWIVRNGKAERTPVTVGVAGTDLVQITNGVNEGDRIVVRGADQVRAGQKL